jgi:hypothetical protein
MRMGHIHLTLYIYLLLGGRGAWDDPRVLYSRPHWQMKWKAKPKFLQECSIFFKLSKQKTQCTQNFWSVSSAFFSNTKGGSRAPAARFLDPFDTTLPSCGNSYRNLQHLRKLGPMGGQVSPDPSLASQPFSLQSGRYNAQMHWCRIRCKCAEGWKSRYRKWRRGGTALPRVKS